MRSIEHMNDSLESSSSGSSDIQYAINIAFAFVALADQSVGVSDLQHGYLVKNS